MAPETVGIIGVAALLALLALRVPIGVALGAVALCGLYYLRGFGAMLGSAESMSFAFVTSWELSAIPLFILMGAISFHAGLAASIYRAARLWLSGLPGGLAVATNFASAGFAAASGSSLATAAAMGRLAIPEMLKAGYQPALSSAVVAASGTLGSMIPPSIMLVLYGLFAQQPVGQLLLAGLLPGLLTACVYGAMIIVRCRFDKRLAPKSDESISWSDRLAVLGEVWPLPLLILAVVGVIYAGIATATEAAAIGCIASLAIAAGMRRLSFKVLKDSLVESARSTGMIFFIAVGATLFTRFLALTGLPFMVADLAGGSGTSPLMLMFVAGLIYIVLGMFLDPLGLLLLTLPIFLPLFESAGFDMLWVGIMVVKFIEIGLITPPLGLNAFVVKGAVGDLVPLNTIFRGLIWFFAAEIFVLVLLYLFPQIALWLPQMSFAG
ncbi:C4-dicarboxylate ABC transporter [Salinisphaera orenii MK-B5]|uniref:TRAP transporter large permease protein n=1 Tax=Salinisphaera orenii MK-B5 TaxID=856730 RepID=A0A423PG22_9GAMM|nr:TRAP transporter large permease subunit [Salinisphaera orenii]ROO24520.1 C4-dicarboxylate ABC transporter [Salinisphaera orenii MK-B5]